MTPDAPDAIRCTHLLGGGLRCTLTTSHVNGHVYVSGSFAEDKHKGQPS